MNHAPKASYWASNIIYGVGLGTKSLAEGICYGIGGVVYEPYKGARDHGLRGLPGGVAKGIFGFVGRPVKGTFDFIAQPIAGAINTPNFLYKKIVGSDENSHRTTNFKLFGLENVAEDSEAEDVTQFLAPTPQLGDDEMSFADEEEDEDKRLGEIKEKDAGSEKMLIDQDRDPADMTSKEMISSWNESQFQEFSCVLSAKMTEKGKKSLVARWRQQDSSAKFSASDF